jgi:Xaa-Pro aminopeptidase
MNTFEERLNVVRQKLDEWEVEGVLIGSGSNRRWLSGFTGSSGQLLITAESAIIATDSRYYEQAQNESPAFTLFKHQRTKEDNEKLFEAAGVGTIGVGKIGVEAQHTTLAAMSKLRKIEGIEWKSLPNTIEPLRQIKTDTELRQIRAAAELTDFTMSQVNQLARPGQTERELAWELEKTMREAGAEATAFTIIVASGPNSALPHHRPGDRVLTLGDSIVIDMGAQLDGYNSDLTRTFYLGDEPSQEFWRVYNLVLGAQTAVFFHLRPGANCKAVDKVARDIINNAGHEEHFGHGLGHGLGLDVHEGPRLSRLADDDAVLAAGMVVTIEPGVYIPGWGGVRIEDLVTITATGFRRLSLCPKLPIIPVHNS